MVTIPTAPLAAQVQVQNHRGVEMNSEGWTARREGRMLLLCCQCCHLLCLWQFCYCNFHSYLSP